MKPLIADVTYELEPPPVSTTELNMGDNHNIIFVINISVSMEHRKCGESTPYTFVTVQPSPLCKTIRGRSKMAASYFCILPSDWPERHYFTIQLKLYGNREVAQLAYKNQET